MELITTSRGGPKLLHEGYAYTKQRAHESTVRWECSKKKTAMCKGSLITDVNVSRVHAVTGHTHAADNVAMSALKVRKEIMDTAEASGGRPGQILADKLATCPLEVRAALGKRESLKRQIRRAKRGAAPPTDPRAMEGVPYPFPGGYGRKLPESGRPFITHDGESQDSRLVGFASDDGPEPLRAARGWRVGGSHSTAPRRFAQLVCVRVSPPQTAVALGRRQLHV
ncbi:uncharacterized protein LOC125024614 [Penaeus chinensis]|uniref:uncharacterized protein LOC125024614 n=1 Tax=Penaeus chinensis TaxID=139456 RepID=UPI001FB789A7|nr:uncharacterized protein LOC125024614 [Penaeus chinensis]